MNSPLTSYFFLLTSYFFLLTSCGTKNSSANTYNTTPNTQLGPAFNADSALWFCQQQCDFGPRTMNSEAHERCAQWIADRFRLYGMDVTNQQATLQGYDGTQLRATNIIASYRPDAAERILLCAHWDSRPWADNDPEEANHKTPVMAANDGASGVGVMLEVARLLSADTTSVVGVDFICFDAEDWGVPEWATYDGDSGETWALGSRHWADNPHRTGYRARFGILLDMVGGQGAKFYQEGVSLHYARSVVDRVWQAAEVVGYSSYFPRQEGHMITDDHLPVNQTARIPCIDIIPYYPDCPSSSFGPTWHTVNDDMAHLDKTTLKAVGQTLVQVIYTEN